MIIISSLMEQLNPADAIVEGAADSTSYIMPIRSESKEVVLSQLEHIKDPDQRVQCVRDLTNEFLSIKIFQESFVLNLYSLHSFLHILRYLSLRTQSLRRKKNSSMICFSARNHLQITSLLV